VPPDADADDASQLPAAVNPLASRQSAGRRAAATLSLDHPSSMGDRPTAGLLAATGRAPNSEEQRSIVFGVLQPRRRQANKVITLLESVPLANALRLPLAMSAPARRRALPVPVARVSERRPSQLLRGLGMLADTVARAGARLSFVDYTNPIAQAQPAATRDLSRDAAAGSMSQR